MGKVRVWKGESMEMLVVKQTEYCAGKGGYARGVVRERAEVFIFSEQVVSCAKATHRTIQTGKNCWLEPAKESYGHYLNHSCSPTCGFQLPNKIVALREIKDGEEITIDYSTIVHTPKWEMDCCCPSSQCRKLVRSFQKMPAEFQKKYQEFNSWAYSRKK